ncbi:MAG: HAMP domain-containing sensor histidine kinase, partial [Patescibacteria group bacterium]
IVGAVEVFRDITKEKGIDKAKTEFVSLASHQLRTPLSTVNWYSEMLLTGDVGEISAEQKMYLEEIYKGNQRMVDLVNTLLDVSRIELGTFDGESKPTNIVGLVESVVDEQKLQVAEKKLKISCIFAVNIPLIQVDPKLLRMVIQNLLSNSIKYTPERGRIEVALLLDDKKNVIFKITDTGYGIPKNQYDKIFTKLFRADNVIGKDTEGTGLGLYIAKSIVEQSGGKLWFESEENKGSTFYASLQIGKPKKNGVPANGT